MSNPGEIAPKVSYGRIVRDEQGNVIDIILEEDEQVQEDQEGGVKGALNPEKEYEPEAVEAKTDVVRCESPSLSLPASQISSSINHHHYPKTTRTPPSTPCLLMRPPHQISQSHIIKSKELRLTNTLSPRKHVGNLSTRETSLFNIRARMVIPARQKAWGRLRTNVTRQEFERLAKDSGGD